MPLCSLLLNEDIVGGCYGGCYGNTLHGSEVAPTIVSQPTLSVGLVHVTRPPSRRVDSAG